MLGLDLFRLRVFVTVVDRHGYSAAARHLHIAQSTVSRHVAELERSCGTQLVSHDAHAVRLTDAGRVVYQAAGSMLGDGERLARSLSDLRHGRSGRVRLGVSMALERDDFLRDVIAPFCRRHDGIALSLRFGHSRTQAEAVLAHELDLAYVLRTDLPDRVSFEPVRKMEFAFLVAAGHPLAGRADVTVDDVRDAGVITTPLRASDSPANRRILQQHGIGEADIRMEVGGQQARLMMAATGVGVLATFVPQRRGTDPGDGLVRLALGAVTTVDIGLVLQPDAVTTADTALLAAWLRAHAR